MKSFACGDVVPNCEASWVCTDEDELLVNVARHASADHGIDVITPELVAAVRAHITSD